MNWNLYQTWFAVTLRRNTNYWKFSIWKQLYTHQNNFNSLDHFRMLNTSSRSSTHRISHFRRSKWSVFHHYSTISSINNQRSTLSSSMRLSCLVNRSLTVKCEMWMLSLDVDSINHLARLHLINSLALI